MNNFNKEFLLLLCVIDSFNKNACVVPLKVEIGITITNAFQKSLNQSNRRWNKIWVDKGSKCINEVIVRR